MCIAERNRNSPFLPVAERKKSMQSRAKTVQIVQDTLNEKRRAENQVLIPYNEPILHARTCIYYMYPTYIVHIMLLYASSVCTLYFTAGKWTTYRSMAKDTVDKAVEVSMETSFVHLYYMYLMALYYTRV